MDLGKKLYRIQDGILARVQLFAIALVYRAKADLKDPEVYGDRNDMNEAIPDGQNTIEAYCYLFFFDAAPLPPKCCYSHELFDTFFCLEILCQLKAQDERKNEIPSNKRGAHILEP